MKKLLKILLLFICTVITYNVVSYATEARISSTSATINSGEEISISVTSDIQVSAYAVRITGNTGLEFVTSSGGVGAGSQNISNALAQGGTTNLAVFKFKAPEVDKDTTYRVTFSASGMGDVNLDSIPNPAPCTSTITVKAKEQPNQGGENTGNSNQGGQSTGNQNQGGQTATQTKSTDATLRNLGITKNEEKKIRDFTGFKPNIYSYPVNGRTS